MLACLAAPCITGAAAIDGDTTRLDSPGEDLRRSLATSQKGEKRSVRGQALMKDPESWRKSRLD